MRILYINHYAGSLNMGMELRPYYLSREWMNMGNDVLVVSSSFSHLRRINPIIEHDFEITDVEGVNYLWFVNKPYVGNGFARAKNIFSFSLKLKLNAKKIVNFFKPDVVITSSTYPLDSYGGNKIAKIAKCKYVHEGHDLWPLTLTEIGGMKKWNPFIILMAGAERYAYRNADSIVSLLPYSYEYMLGKGLKNIEKFSYIPNGVASQDWDNPEEMPEEHTRLIQNLKKEGKTIIMYTGGHALSNKLDTFIDAAIMFKSNDSVAFVLIGSGAEKEKLVKKVLLNGAQNVVFLNPISKKAIPTALGYADALYIVAKKSTLYRYGVSLNKVYDYMMSGKPIIYGVEAKNNEVKEADCGVYFDSDNVDSLVECIRLFLDMPFGERKKLGSNGKKWVINHCEYKVLAKKMLNLFD